MAAADEIMSFLHKECSIEVTADGDLLRDGLLDSLSLMRLVDFMEERLQIQLDPEDINPENFNSVVSLSDLVQKKRT